MASKGRKTGAGKPAAPKAATRAKAAPKPAVAAAAAEKAEPVVEKEPKAPIAAEPVPAAEAVPQEVETASEAVEAVTTDAVEAEVEAVEAVEAETAETLDPVEVFESVEAIVETAAEAALEPVVEIAAAFEAAAVSSSKETIVMETIETNFAKAQAFFSDINDRAKVAVEKSTKMVEEANEFAKGNLEAIVESGKITAKGLESFGQDAAEYSRKSFETATAALKGMASVKSPTEFFKLQSDYFRSSFDSAVAEASKTTEALIKLVGDASQPISNRVSLAAEKVKLAA